MKLLRKAFRPISDLVAPVSCAATPPRLSAGYGHWCCERPRGHMGVHRHGAYWWTPQRGALFQEGKVCS